MFYIKKSIKAKKIKHYLDKIDSTIDELRSYEMIAEMANSVSKNLDDDELKNLFHQSESFEDSKLIDYCKKNSPSLLKKLKKIPERFSGEDWEYFKELVKAEYEKPQLKKVENIAFAGGGAKGFSYPGVIRAFNENDIDFKRVSGTSAGAITALPLALGYSPRKIESIVYSYDFTNFIYESNLNRSYVANKIMGFFSDENEALMHRSVYLDTFYEEFKEPFLQHLIYSGKIKDLGMNINQDHIDKYGLKKVIDKTSEKFEERDISLAKRKALSNNVDASLGKIIKDAQTKARNAFIESVKDENPKIEDEELNELLSHGFGNEKDALQTFFRIHRKEDVIEEFFGDLIENKLMTLGKKKLNHVDPKLSNPKNLRNIDFETFEKLVEAYPESHLKSLCVCVCEKKSSNPLLALSKDNYEQIDVSAENESAEIREIPLKKAVRMSMNLPGAYSSYHYKGKEYVDGGVRANFPLHYFDDVLGIKKGKTLGVSLATEDSLRRTKDVNKIGVPDEAPMLEQDSYFGRLFKKLSNAVKRNFSELRDAKLDNNGDFDPVDLKRIGIINVKNVGTTNFNLSKSEKLELFEQGYDTAKSMMKEQYSAQHRHLEQRIESLFDYVADNLSEKDIIHNVMESHYASYVKAATEYESIKSRPTEQYSAKSRISKLSRS